MVTLISCLIRMPINCESHTEGFFFFFAVTWRIVSILSCTNQENCENSLVSFGPWILPPESSILSSKVRRKRVDETNLHGLNTFLQQTGQRVFEYL